MPSTVNGVYRFLFSRQWVILTLVALALIPTMIKLGFWQLHRHEHKVALNTVISDSLTAKPVPAESVTRPGQEIGHDDLFRRVTARGHFDTAHEEVVRRRTNADGEVGYHVLTPFVLADGRVLMVNRGWVPADGAQTAFPKIPAPAQGEITVTGRIDGRPDDRRQRHQERPGPARPSGHADQQRAAGPCGSAGRSSAATSSRPRRSPRATPPN